jgi:hypothetical protein
MDMCLDFPRYLHLLSEELLKLGPKVCGLFVKG